MKNVLRLAIGLALLLPGPAPAAHPLITDDAGTQGTGKYLFELNGQYSRDNEGSGEIERSTQAAASFTYGITDALDLAFGIPWQKSDIDDAGATTSSSGPGDAGLALKWRFFEREGLCLALKPGFTLPTGDFDKGLGNGKATASMFLIATSEMKPVLLHVNLGYIRNESNSQDRVDLWHASVAGEYCVSPSLRFVANVGTDTNPQHDPAVDPAFLLGGVIYSVTESFDVDFGLKHGLNNAEPGLTTLAGIAVRW
jgi:outer membrane putative beta-barrel porin/alpha-amylase